VAHCDEPSFGRPSSVDLPPPQPCLLPGPGLKEVIFTKNRAIDLLLTYVDMILDAGSR